MAAYLIVDVDIHDPEAYEEYKAKAPAIVRRHGGEYVVRGGKFVVLEGEWTPSRLAMIRFPDLASAQALYDDPEYQPLKALRKRVSRMNIVVVEGI